MKTRITGIDNSQSAPSPTLALESNIGSVRQPRQEWEDEFRAMAERGDDELLDENLLAQTHWDKNEWQW